MPQRMRDSQPPYTNIHHTHTPPPPTPPGWPLEAVQPPVALLPAGAAMPMSTHTLGAWAQRVRLAAEALLLLREILKGSDELCE